MGQEEMWPEDEISRAISIPHEERRPKLEGGPYYVAPDSAPPWHEGTMARINPATIGVDQVTLDEAMSSEQVQREIKRLQKTGGSAIQEALKRIGQRTSNH